MSGNAERHAGPWPEGHEARKFLRKKSLLPATLVTERGSVDCRVLDFSAGGAKLECADPPAEGEMPTVIIEGIGTFAGRVIWRSEHHVGVKFDNGSELAEARRAIAPSLTPLGTDPPEPVCMAEHDPASFDEPQLPTPGADFAVTTISPVSDPTEIVAVASKPAGTTAEPSATETPTAPTAGAKYRRSRVFKLKPHGEDVFTLSAGQPLFQEGDPGGRMYVVRTGTLRIQGGAPGDEEEIGSGAIVGEMELLERDLRRRTTVIAVTDCELMEIDARRFRLLIGERPDFALAVMHALSGRLRHMGDHRVADGTGMSPRDPAADGERTLAK